MSSAPRTTAPSSADLRVAARRALLHVPPLDVHEAAQILRAVGQRYHRTLNIEVERILLDKQQADCSPASASPLWVTLAAEEMHLLDADDFARTGQFEGGPERQLVAMLKDVAMRIPPAVADLYPWVLDRADDAARGWAVPTSSAASPSAGAGPVRVAGE